MLFFLFTFIGKYIKNNNLIRICSYAIFILSISILAYTWLPKTNDLTRHFIYLDRIRNYNGNILEFVFNADIGGEQYSTLYAFNIYRFVIAKIFRNNSMFPVVTVIIDYVIFFYIAYDYNKGKRGMLSAVSFEICFACLPLIFAISGIRNGLAASFMALGIYLYLYKKKNWKLFFFIAIVSALMHPATLMAVPFVILSKFEIGLKGVIFVFLFIISLNGMMTLLLNSNNEYVSQFSRYYMSYTSENQYKSSMYYLYMDLVILVILLVTYIICKKNIQKKEDSQIYYFIMLYSVAILAFIGNYDMILRPCYLLGILSPVIGELIENENYWPSGLLWLRKSVKLFLTVFFIYFFIRYMRFFYVWSYNKF